MPKKTSRLQRSQSVAVYSGLFQFIPSRSQRRIIQILEATIHNYVTIGIENVTYDSIAKTCKVSRPLVQHYFKDKMELFAMVAKYIRLNFQQIAVDAIRAGDSPAQQLEGYVSSLFTWVNGFPMHAKVWNLVFYYAGVDPAVRVLHTELVNMGHDRITALLESGAEAGVFAPGEFRKRAKLIQALYTGGLVMVTAEDLYVDQDTFRRHLIEGCLRMAMQG